MYKVSLKSHISLDGTEESLTYQGFRCYYRVIRNRISSYKPVIFIIGAFQSMDSWKKYAQYFSKETTVVLIDLPGVGKSDLLPENYGIDFLADLLKFFIERLSLSKSICVSASYGTSIAYKFGQKYPNYFTIQNAI